MARDAETHNGVEIPGKDLDPEGSLEKHVKIGWALVGIAFSAGLLGYLLQRLGLSIWPEKPEGLDYVRLLAFVVSCLNILFWMWFPLEDLEVLRKWVRTRREVFPCHTSEFFAILLGTALLLVLVPASLLGPVWFGLAGTGVYLWNLVGFALIRRKVQQAVGDARSVYGEAPSPKAEILHRVLNVIDHHWSSAPSHHWLVNKQQVRHATLTLLFLLAALLGALRWQLAAYVVGAGTIVGAEVSIAIWRTRRDHALVELYKELRVLDS